MKILGRRFTHAKTMARMEAKEEPSLRKKARRSYRWTRRKSS